MRSINKIILIGAVGQPPEVRFTANGMPVATFSLATNKKRKDKEEVVSWHSCVAFGKTAEIIQQYVTKGSKLYVEGEIDYQVSDKNGVKTYYTKIIVNELSLLSAQSMAEQKEVSTATPARAFEEHEDSIPF